MTQVNQATRPARRLYVGGIPSPCYDFMLTTFLNQVRNRTALLLLASVCSLLCFFLPAMPLP